MTRLEALLLYQKADLKKQETENAVKNTESRQKMAKLHKLLKEQQANIQKLTDEVEALQLSLARLIAQQEKQAHELEVNIDELENLQNDEECTAAEMTEFRQDVDTLGKELMRIEKDVKTLTQQIDEKIEQFQRTRTLAGKAKKDYDQVKAVCEVEKNDSISEITRCEKEIADRARQVDPRLLEKYKRARLHHSQPVVAVVNGKCSGCNMSLPMAVIKKLAGQDEVMECENCGRILYQPDKSY